MGGDSKSEFHKTAMSLNIPVSHPIKKNLAICGLGWWYTSFKKLQNNISNQDTHAQ